MYAIIETGGKQYKVEEGSQIKVEKLGIETSEEVSFDKVLVVNNGSETTFGKPYIESAVVKGVSLGNGKNKKVIVYKYKPKKGFHKKKGHRQPFTMVKIEKITV